MTTKMNEMLYAEINLICCALIILIIIRIIRSQRRDVCTRIYVKALSGFILFLLFDTIWAVIHAADFPMGSAGEYLLEYLYLGFLHATSANLFIFLRILVENEGKLKRVFLSILPACTGIREFDS